MDKEYIDREYYCNNICRCPGTECDKTKCPIWIAPAADVAPVVHSRWMISSDGYYPYCEHCQTEPVGGKMTKYCHNCGAVMDGGDENAVGTGL